MTALPPTALASVALPGGGSTVRSFPLPPPGPDTGWLRVEASAVCGTDVALHAGGLDAARVLGHHVVGTVAAAGAGALRRWKVRPGDQVALEEYLPCGRCPACTGGRYRLCPDTDLWGATGRRVGLVPVTEPPGLWGGNAQYLHLPANAVLHPLPPGLPSDLAVWTLPLANALDWTLGAGALQAGETVVVLGPGYHGLAAAAAGHARAGQVIVGGRATDRERLRLAARLGAVTVETAALEATIAERTGGRMADVVVDTTGGGPDGVATALGLAGQLGRVVLTGVKTPAPAEVDTGILVSRALTVRGVRGRAPERVTESIALLAGGTSGLEVVPSVTVTLAGTGPMLERLAAGAGPSSPHVVVRPWDGEEAR